MTRRGTLCSLCVVCVWLVFIGRTLHRKEFFFYFAVRHQWLLTQTIRQRVHVLPIIGLLSCFFLSLLVSHWELRVEYKKHTSFDIPFIFALKAPRSINACVHYSLIFMLPLSPFLSIDILFDFDSIIAIKNRWRRFGKIRTCTQTGIERSQQTNKSERRKGRTHRKAMVRTWRLEIWCAFARPLTISRFLSSCASWIGAVQLLSLYMASWTADGSSSRCNRFDNNMQCTFAHTKPFQWISKRFGILMCIFVLLF